MSMRVALIAALALCMLLFAAGECLAARAARPICIAVRLTGASTPSSPGEQSNYVSGSRNSSGHEAAGLGEDKPGRESFPHVWAWASSTFLWLNRDVE